MHVVDGVEMVDVQEAARLASRSPETIRRWVWSGKVAATKVGTKLLIPRTAVDTDSSPRVAGTLASWVATLPVRTGQSDAGPGPTAADLLLEDRYERGYGAGS